MSHVSATLFLFPPDSPIEERGATVSPIELATGQGRCPPLSGLDFPEVGQLAEELVDSCEQRQPIAADSLVLVHHQD